MTEAAREVLTSFDALSPADREEVTAAILRRVASSGPLSEEALHEVADELFRGYDAEDGRQNAVVNPGMATG